MLTLIILGYLLIGCYTLFLIDPSAYDNLYQWEKIVLATGLGLGWPLVWLTLGIEAIKQWKEDR